MNKYLFVPILAILFASCSNPTASVLSFTHERVSPTMYTFYSTSVGFDELKWDFGDGTWSYGNEAIHTFPIGSYTVTLIGTLDGIRYEAQQRIVVTKPEAYIAGYTLYSIPYNDRYYKLSVKDDNLLPSAWDWETVYTRMLDADDLPYTVEFKNPVLMENLSTHTYYTVTLYRTTDPTSSSNDVKCMSQKLKVSDITDFYNPEYVLQTESGNTIVGIIMEYDY